MFHSRLIPGQLQSRPLFPKDFPSRIFFFFFSFLYSGERNFNFLEKTKTGSSSYRNRRKRDKTNREREREGEREAARERVGCNHGIPPTRKFDRERVSNASMTFHPLFDLFPMRREKRNDTCQKANTGEGRWRKWFVESCLSRVSMIDRFVRVAMISSHVL